MVDGIAQHTTSNADPARARNAPKKSIAAILLILSVFAMSEGSQYRPFPTTVDLSEWHKEHDGASGKDA